MQRPMPRISVDVRRMHVSRSLAINCKALDMSAVLPHDVEAVLSKLYSHYTPTIPTPLYTRKSVLEFARQSGPSLLTPPPPPPSLSLSLSLCLHKLEILNWLGPDLLQSAVRFAEKV